jgi:hypothetical protein
VAKEDDLEKVKEEKAAKDLEEEEQQEENKLKYFSLSCFL